MLMNLIYKKSYRKEYIGQVSAVNYSKVFSC